MVDTLNIKLFKFTSGELIVCNVKDKGADAYEVEYPAVIQQMNTQILLIPFIPAFVENMEELMKHFVIYYSFVVWSGQATKQMVNIYSDFMLKIQSSFSGIQVIGSMGNIPRNFKV